MDEAIARELCALNNEFYRENAASFSATREMPWPGWRRVLRHLRPSEAAGESGASSALAVLDAACGNLRFERFLTVEYAGDFNAFAVDSCDALALGALREHDFGRGAVDYHHADLVRASLDGGAAGLALALGTTSCDAAVCFGFMHHVPGERNRVALLKALAGAVRPGGIVAVSLWRFAEGEKGGAKAQETDARAFRELPVLGWRFREEDLEAGDHILGWKNAPGAWRYCHSFSDDEVQRMIDAVSAEASVVDRFYADGKTGDMNAYVIFKR